MKSGKARKIISWTIDGLLVGIIAVLIYVQVSMVVTKKDNHGVPMAFGRSFLYVATDSMTIPDDPNCIGTGSGIIIEKVNDISKLKVSNPILDEQGNIKDYDLKGDVVTFYYPKIGAPDTHRLIGLEQKDGVWTFTTMGDNPVAHQRMSKETWTQDNLIGKEVYHSMGLGTFLTIASPDAAAYAGTTAWLLPVAVVVPLVLLAGMSVFDVFRAAKKEEQEEEAKMLLAMQAAGVDPNDEEAAELFRQKEELKIEYRAKMEEELERAKKEARKKALKDRRKGDAKE